MIKRILVFSISFLFFIIQPLISQDKPEEILSDAAFSGLQLRSIGPAFMSGRIADIAIHPEDPNTWIVGVGSGGVWKTINAGTTWKPVFDEQKVYSIGCVSYDTRNPNIVWVGTGENVGGRHVSFGDGIYKSEDGGDSWTNMGLKKSEHISKIITHPDNSDILWVAAQGPLWAKGGERGVYKSTDGGKTWKQTLGDQEWIGATDLVIDPRNPNRLYAATWQRHRNIAAYMGGGPGTALYRSEDAGETWIKLEKGLPTSNMGKIGLAISHQEPDVLYAVIELDRTSGGVWKTTNRGASWTKQSDMVSGGTGPHYYQELYTCPHNYDRLYLMDYNARISDDGGKTWRAMNEQHKHGDNHALAFRMDDPDYLLIGTDGGVYETFDLCKTWKFFGNLPITQFYKLAVDDSEPFYYIYGGTQDNNTQGGPSRTDNFHGIRNSDWFITLFGDGHQPATEPGNPDIIYSQWQQGNIVRVDRTTGEMIYIKPVNAPDEDYERYNWDAPILVSPHSPTRIYFGSQRLWRSDNRGDSWTALSPDLTRNQERITLPIMGKTWSWDAAWDLGAMSTYNTITSISESPLQEGLIFTGTDDGIIQITTDGGANWKKIEVGRLPGVPRTAYVNDIKADLHDVNTVYIALDNHKFGDFKPYLLKSTDQGNSWKSIASNIPGSDLVWRIVQDHVSPNLLFIGTEFGIYFSIDSGAKWIKLKGGVPTISFRDLAIQKRENDLVGASFGRSFYVFDDYSVLREVSEEKLKQEAALFSTRKAWWYKAKPVLGFGEKGSQGSSYFTAKNPPFGAVFTYHLAESYQTKEEMRKKSEKELTEKKQDPTFPGWDALDEEINEEKPKVWLTIKDSDGRVVRKLEGPTKKGFHRVSWDLGMASKSAIEIGGIPSGGGFFSTNYMVAPGTYTVSLSKEVDGVVTSLSDEKSFEVARLREGALPGATPAETVAFWKRINQSSGILSSLRLELKHTQEHIDAMEKALAQTDSYPGELDNEINRLKREVRNLERKLRGNSAKNEVGEKQDIGPGGRLNNASFGTSFSTYGPTPMHIQNLELAESAISDIRQNLTDLVQGDLKKLTEALKKAGAPFIGN